MQPDLTTALCGDVGIAALAERRVFWRRRPQSSALPAVVLHRIHARPEYTLDGRSSLTSYIVQFDCLAKTYTEALALSKAVEAALEGLTSAPFEGAFIRDLRDDNEPDDGPKASPVADTFLVSLDAQVWHRTA